MHLRIPSIDKGVLAFIWAFVFFLVMWLGAVLLDVSGGVAFVLSLVAAAAIFVFIRIRGEEPPRPHS
jgi:hypothetical protein